MTSLKCHVGHSNRMCGIFTVCNVWRNQMIYRRKKIVILTEKDEVPDSKFTSCPEDYTVDQLKRWLKCRGSKQSGKRQELITRVKDCIASGNHHLLDPGIDGGKWLKAKEDREHGSNLTDHKSLVPDPPQKNWRVFPSYDIPSLFNYGLRFRVFFYKFIRYFTHYICRFP